MRGAPTSLKTANAKAPSSVAWCSAANDVKRFPKGYAKLLTDARAKRFTELTVQHTTARNRWYQRKTVANRDAVNKLVQECEDFLEKECGLDIRAGAASAKAIHHATGKSAAIAELAAQIGALAQSQRMDLEKALDPECSSALHSEAPTGVPVAASSDAKSCDLSVGEANTNAPANPTADAQANINTKAGAEPITSTGLAARLQLSVPMESMPFLLYSCFRRPMQPNR